MKTLFKSIIVVAIVMAGFGKIIAQSDSSKSAEFKVYGNCEMCEERIEEAANDVNGVESADWNVDTKMIVVLYNPEQVEVLDVHNAIAKVGHDTDKVYAEDSEYKNLPECCQFDRRPKDKVEANENEDGDEK